LLARSDDIVECKGYRYFPAADVRLDLLRKARRTVSDLACPHGVRFYDAVIDGERYRRVAWNYEAPRPTMKQVRDRFGFWGEVKVRAR
jgi:uncharacterized protein (DUF427 family)